MGDTADNTDYSLQNRHGFAATHDAVICDCYRCGLSHGGSFQIPALSKSCSDLSLL